MRLTAILLMVSALHVCAGGFAQKVTLSRTNATLKEVLMDIYNQTRVSYSCQHELLEKAARVTVFVKDASLDQALAICFKGQPLAYSLMDNVIVITDKATAEITHQAPLIDIHGRVVDESGKPVAGVTVTVKGMKKQTFTDENGEFIFKATEDDAILIFSSVNMEAFQLNVKGERDLVVTLKPKLAVLGEVAIEVNTGYQKIPKERATGSFVFVDNKLFNRHVSTDVIGKLDGVVPGLIFNKSTLNTANGNYDINIQGHNTLFSNDQPLIVVDNFPYDGDLSNLNPNDVESVTVLKDAAAASIWGVRSGNGVIVVTTKTGRRNQKPKVELNANFTIGDKPDLYYNPNFLDASDYIDAVQNLFNKGYYTSTLTSPYTLVSPVVQILAQQKAGTISGSDATNQINILRTQDVRRDLSRYFYQKALKQQYAINVKGGGTNNDYFVSVGFDGNKLNFVGNSNQRITINSIYNFYVSKRLQVSMGMNYVQSHGRSNSSLGSIVNVEPYTKLADDNGNPLAVSTDYTQNYKDSLTRLGYLNWQNKPLAEIGLADNDTKEIENRINFGLKEAIFSGVGLEIRYQYERSNSSIDDYYSDSTYYARNLINQYSQRSTSGVFTYPIPVGGVLRSSGNTLTSHQIRGMVNVEHTWNNLHNLNLISGAEIRQAKNEGSSNTAYGYDQSTGNSISTVDFATYFPLKPIGSNRIPNALGYSKTTNNFISYFSNAAYSYNNLYILSISGRVDHSNLFGVNTNQKAVPLFSAGLAWNLSREKFYHINWLPYLKPRMTYGYTANINTSATAVTTISQRTNSPFNGLTYATIANPGNPELRWEKVRKVNFGLDFSIKKNVIFGSIDYYFKKGINLFGNSPLAPSTGLTTFFGNTAETQGHGFDLTLTSRNISNKNFKWNTGLILSNVIDKVTQYDVKSTALYFLSYGSGSTGAIAPRIGSPIFGVYSYEFAGLTNTTGDPQGLVGGKPSTDYNAIINNATVDSLKYNGPARPTVFGSLMNTFQCKKFTLSFNIIYEFNYYFRRSSMSDVNGFGLGIGGGNSDYSKRWQQPGDEQHTNVPSILYPPFNTNRASFYKYSSALVDKGDNVRLQDISLSYDLDKSVIKSLPFTQIQLFFYANNLAILWRANKDGLDPDIYAGANAFPVPRTYSIGFKAEF